MKIVLLLSDGTRIKIGTTKDQLSGFGDHSEMSESMPIPPKDSTITFLGRNYSIKSNPNFNIDLHEIELSAELTFLSHPGYLVLSFIEHLKQTNENLYDLLKHHSSRGTDWIVTRRFMDFCNSIQPEYEVKGEDVTLMRKTANWLNSIETN